MDHEATQLVATAFSLMRSLGKQKPDNGSDRILAAIVEHNRREDEAGRWAWEKQWG